MRPILSAILLWMAVATVAPAEDLKATIIVDVAKCLGKVNPWVFGNNMLGYQKSAWQHTRPDYSDRGSGIWDPEARRSVPELVALAKNIGLSVARWPGGCGVHLFDWKKTVGPIDKRPEQRFGLPEFLQNCRDLGAEPLVTVAEYFGTARDAADLVEYLNAPNEGTHRWAALRAADGHAEPWGVVWFEYGNESEHGDHHGTRMTAEQYARNYLAYQAAMKAVDPRIKLGAVIATGFPKLENWARPVLQVVGPKADFVIHHSYLPGYGRNDGEPDAKTLFAASLAIGDQIQDYYDEMNALIRATAGRSLPIAVTEFNGSFVQQKPVPYRHCLGNALVNAEMLRVFLRPQNQIVMANFWQFANEYWGQVKGYVHQGDAMVKRPQYFPFELYHNHFGPELVEARVECGSFETDGCCGVTAHRGKGSRFQLLGPAIRLTDPWRLAQQKGIAQHVEGDTLAVEFQKAGDVNYFHARKFLSAEPNLGYRVSGWIKTEGLTSGRGACLQVGDARGWTVTRSAVHTPDVTGTKDWARVEVDYVALPDTRQIEVVARRISGSGPIEGRAMFRDLQVQKFQPKCFAAVPYVSVNASRTIDRRKVFLMVVNKNLVAPVTAGITLAGFQPRHARAWTMTGPEVDATNEKDPSTVTVKARDLGDVAGAVRVELAPHSLTAIEIDSAGP